MQGGGANRGSRCRSHRRNGPSSRVNADTSSFTGWANASGTESRKGRMWPRQFSAPRRDGDKASPALRSSPDALIRPRVTATADLGARPFATSPRSTFLAVHEEAADGPSGQGRSCSSSVRKNCILHDTQAVHDRDSIAASCPMRLFSSARPGIESAHALRSNDDRRDPHFVGCLAKGGVA